MLLCMRASVDAAGPQQDTPRMLAASAGHAPTAELLLERGADANAVGTGRENAARGCGRGWPRCGCSRTLVPR